ncbi:MAG TPA: diacylglycerol kinase family protein [Ktedonobacterales bacterium]|nr:diacylglycerol kinase family protein [Ktedonobacterales bacterium]
MWNGMKGDAVASWRDRLADWWNAHLTGPRTRVVARTGIWTLRVTGWAVAARTVMETAQRTTTRVRTVFKLAYYVLPAAPAGRSQQSTLPAARGTTRARIIVNPQSGSMRLPWAMHELEQTAWWLTRAGLPTEVCLTKYPGHAVELAREAVRANMDIVVAAGGDGTVNNVLQELAGHTTALGVLPLGTVNVWAREMGIPLNLTQARNVLVHGVRRRVDLGRAGSRYFLMMAGIGFDAEVALRVERSWLKRLGLKLLDYLATASALTITHQPTKIWMRSDGKRRSVQSLMIIIGNTRLYGGKLSFATHAVADDGLLDLVVVGGGGLRHRAGVVLRAVLRRPARGPQVRYSRIHTIRLESNTEVPVQVDGEVIGTLPMTFSIAPHALTVIVPEQAPAALFQRMPLLTTSLEPASE